MIDAERNRKKGSVFGLVRQWPKLLVFSAVLAIQPGHSPTTASEPTECSTVVIASPSEVLPVVKLTVVDEPAGIAQTDQPPVEAIPAQAAATVPEPVAASAVVPAPMMSMAPIAPRALLPEPGEAPVSGSMAKATLEPTPPSEAEVMTEARPAVEIDFVAKASSLVPQMPVAETEPAGEGDVAAESKPVERPIAIPRPEPPQPASSVVRPNVVAQAEPGAPANLPPQAEPSVDENAVERYVPFPVPAPSPLVYGYRCGVRCADGAHLRPFAWRGERPIPWEAFAQGEYIGPARLAHVPEYRLRVDDELDFVYIFSVRPSARPYRLNVRDRVKVESLVAPDVVDREVLIQPDGTVTLRLLGQVPAAGLTIQEFREELDKRYAPHIANPSITVTPIELNSYLQELRYSVDRRYGTIGGQGSLARVTPEGTVQLPVVGSVPVQGLTLAEVKREIEERYAYVAEGIEVTPILVRRAPRYFFILGEVRNPGRFTMEAPTTVLQAIAMAGSWSFSGNIKQVVVLRRDDNWCLMATRLNLCGALYGKQPCPPDEIWIRDSDTIIVPKTAIETADELIEQVFTRGIYGVLPVSIGVNFAKLSTI